MWGYEYYRPELFSSTEPFLVAHFLFYNTIAILFAFRQPPDLRGVVSRHAEIRVQALDRHGAAIDTVARGITAGTYQHEVDHLDGILFIDRMPNLASLSFESELHHLFAGGDSDDGQERSDD